MDKAAHAFGRMKMCHMIADTPMELTMMCIRIGVKLKWFQAEASTPHFDIAKGKKELALAAGAVELDRRPYVEVMQRIRQTWPKENGRWLLPMGDGGSK